MFSSLHKIDILAEVDGERLVVQTDHRERVDIEATPEISVLFAMTRVLNAAGWLTAEGYAGRVRYTLQGEAPPFLRDALAAVGARLVQAGSAAEEDLGPASLEQAGALADQAFGALATRTLARYETSDPFDALRQLEADTRSAALDRDADEVAYFSRIAELAALGGELIRVKAGGSWIHHDQALIPFGFRIDQGAIVFPTNRAERFVSDGGQESVMHLLAAVDDVLASRGTVRVMPSLRNRDRVPLDRVAWRPLLETDQGDLPVVVYGEDGESTFALYDLGSLDQSLESLAGDALSNLADEEVQLDRFDLEGMPIAAATGGFYAAEKLLDGAFLRKASRMLGSDLLAAAVPARGVLLLTPANQAPERLGLFAVVARKRFDEAGQHQISPAVVLVHDGQVVGYAAVDLASAPTVGES